MQQVHSFLHEFRTFAIKGNVFDLAVAVVIGAAFGKIVSSLVDSVIMPLLGILLGGVDFTSWNLKIGNAVIAYGAFIQAIVDFTIIAFVIFIAVRFRHRFEKKEEAKPSQPSEELILLREIRDNTRRG
jgi:large conductance mechanosensitive channel